MGRGVEDDELATLREIATGWLTANDQGLMRALEGGFLQEVGYDEEKQDS